MSKFPKTIAIIPARGGSKGIPRKNVRLLNGKPLISYVIESAKGSHYIDLIVVSTDDEEIGRIAEKHGATVVMRPKNLADDEATLDPVIYDVLTRLENQGENFDIVLTIQPTSPLLKASTINEAIEILKKNNFETVITAVKNSHLSWEKINDKFVPKYKERKCRQYLPIEYKESGAILASRRNVISEKNRIGSKVTLLEVDEYEGIDLDSSKDWWIIEKILRRKKVVIRVDGYKEIGLGHIYRMLIMANYIMDHELIFLMDEKYELGINLVRKNNFKMELFKQNPIPSIMMLKPDIVINDILDTPKDYIQTLKDLNIRVFNFEDLGEGAELADGVFNALYPGPIPRENFYTGEKYYCAKPEFINADIKQIKNEVKNVLLTFGGTDPNNLTLKTLKSISKSTSSFDITVILGPGYDKEQELMNEINKINRKITVHYQITNMADYMYKADIIFSSAGRTMYEIAMIGTPAIIIAQNSRELTHIFGHPYNGFINLGIYFDIDDDIILKTLNDLIQNFELRKIMHKRMLNHDLKNGMKLICSIIFDKEGEI
ncbi:cytidylyltransferase domain-containing protein [Priestia megaterium]|uniref:cytidylyltransferase domain-containing protein n=1 Tax=Priestia megaterium TaxID=1404 RepID=UPI00285940FA|nr:glycosyltransferase [Priestia megaterium]MDR7246589.1 CMP-N-acetylneuraminic acid synthetase/spore coat polysaccharide biosynthesis predicted glycosyltransferase SpsG [Priestia megaterium]